MSQKPVSIDLSKLMHEEIINFLPGIFYVYELVEDGFELIYWNRNHEIVTGYSSKELLRKRVLDFFLPDDFKVIEKGLSEILEKGNVKQVNANLLLKNGLTLPYLFEGYKFKSGGKLFFLGVGLDVSSYKMTKSKLDSTRAELDRRNRELFGFTMINEEYLKFKEDLINRFDEFQKIDSLADLKMELMRVNNTLKAELRKFHLLDNFQFRFNQVHPDFFVNLRSKHKTLTNSEMKYCAFLKIKLSTHQISGLLNIGKDAIKKKRYRMRKKMGIGKDPSLEIYLDQF